MIYPHPPQSDKETSAKVVKALIEHLKIEYIAIGDGTYGRETLEFFEKHVFFFFQANQALVSKNDFIYDPFVGTGGLLIPCSHFGAFCFGTEIDKRVLQGYGVGRLNKKSPFYKGFTLNFSI